MGKLIGKRTVYGWDENEKIVFSGAKGKVRGNLESETAKCCHEFRRTRT
jgi:hypothetical protein